MVHGYNTFNYTYSKFSFKKKKAVATEANPQQYTHTQTHFLFSIFQVHTGIPGSRSQQFPLYFDTYLAEEVIVFACACWRRIFKKKDVSKMLKWHINDILQRQTITAVVSRICATTALLQNSPVVSGTLELNPKSL